MLRDKPMVGLAARKPASVNVSQADTCLQLPQSTESWLFSAESVQIPVLVLKSQKILEGGSIKVVLDLPCKKGEEIQTAVKEAKQRREWGKDIRE